MSTAALVTFAEFEQLPDAPGKRELIDGEVIEVPPPRFDHSELAHSIYHLLRAVLLKKRVWIEAGYLIDGGWLQPDVSVLWPGQQLENGYLAHAPQVAIEVLSPSNTAAQIERKLTLYFTEGAAEVWVLDPRSKTFVAYQSTEGQVRRIPVGREYTSPSLNLTIDRASLFED